MYLRLIDKFVTLCSPSRSKVLDGRSGSLLSAAKLALKTPQWPAPRVQARLTACRSFDDKLTRRNETEDDELA
jgi:hypothetical protein